MFVYNVKKVLRALGASSYTRVSVSAVVTSFGLVFPAWWFLVLFGTSLYLYTLWQQPLSIGKSIRRGALFGLVTSGASIWWFWHTLPISWIGLPEGAIQYVVVAVVWGAGALALTLPHALFAPLFVRINDTPLAPILLGLLWVVLEESKMWSFALLVLAPESLFSPYFSITGFGLSLTEHSHLLQLATLGGFPALNFFFGLIVSSIVVITLQIRTQIPSKSRVVSALILIALTIAYPLFLSSQNEDSNEHLRIALITTNSVAGGVHDEKELTQSLVLLKNTNPSPDIVVFPEGYGFTKSTEENSKKPLYTALFGEHETLIVGSTYAPVSAHAGYGELTFESTVSGVLGSHNKTLLVPLGEYLPPALHTLLSLMGDSQLKEYFATQSNRQTLRGDNLTTVTYKNIRLGVLLCSEILSPSLYHTLVQKNGAQVLINVANDAWFHGSPLLYRKTVELAKLHAVQNRVYFLTANNNAPSFVIHPSGAMVAESAWGATVPLMYNVPVSQQ